MENLTNSVVTFRFLHDTGDLGLRELFTTLFPCHTDYGLELQGCTGPVTLVLIRRTVDFIDYLFMVIVVGVDGICLIIWFKASRRINYIGWPPLNIIEDAPDVNADNTISN